MIPEFPEEDPELSKINLSSILKSEVLIFVVVPFTTKSPDRVKLVPVAAPVNVNPANEGESPDCNPVSTSVLFPLIVALTVP